MVRRHGTPAIGLLALLLTTAPGCGAVAREGTGDLLTIGAFSVVREAFHDGILPAFAAHWKRTTGRVIRFEESYNASGAQSRAIAGGFDADVAVLSLEGDVDRLVKAGLVRGDWNAGEHKGMITRSLVVIGVREGNPLGINDWDDLTREGVGVLYPDPKTSGGARWNINAIYGAALLKREPGRTAANAESAEAFLKAVQARVLNMDASGRQSMASFERGTGDAVVTYENELLLQRKLTGKAAPYVIPPSTLLIEAPAALVDASVSRHGNRAVAEAFLDFLRSPEAQRLMMSYGFRPLDPAMESEARDGRGPLPPGLFTMTDLGGWARVNTTLYAPDGVWDQVFTGLRGAR